MKIWKNIAVGVAILILAGPALAYESCDSSFEVGCSYTEPPGYYDGYDDSQANPLRIAAYAVYPVGFALEWLVTRPIHALVSQPPLEPIFGHGPHQWDFCCGIPSAQEVQAVAPAPIVHTEDVEAAQRAAEEARAAAEEAKRAAEEAARAAEKSTRGFEKSLRK